VPASAAWTERRILADPNGSLVFRPLEDSGLPTNRFGLMLRTGADLQFAPAVFYDQARERFRGLELPGTVTT
jgi:hypothetical protein